MTSTRGGQFAPDTGGQLHRILHAYWASDTVLKLFNSENKIESVSPARIGMMTTDNERFTKQWYEVDLRNIGFNLTNRELATLSDFKWFPYNKGGSFKKWYGNNELVVNWKHGGREIIANGMTSFRGKDFYFKKGITWSFINSSNFGVRYKPEGFLFDIQGSSSFPNEDRLFYLTAFLNTKISFYLLSIVNPTLSFQAGNLNSLPFIYNEESAERIAELAIKNIELSRTDWDSNEYSWDFEISPLINEAASISESFLAYYQKANFRFFELHKNEEELNRIFIEIYSLQEELVPDVSLKDITSLQDLLDYDDVEKLKRPHEGQLVPIKKEVVMQQFLSYAIGLLMGRYRLDKPGLNIAHPEATKEELSSYKYNGHSFSIDDDAIMPLLGEDSPFADNVVKRFKDVLVAVWGEETQTENINFLNACLGMPFEKFLMEKFWDYHKRVYQKKPIYWLFTSPAGSFKVLVYMHRMDKFTVQKIRLNYLHRYMEYLGNEVQQADANGTATRTIDKLNKALQDCREYDKILKPLADQQIMFDLDDGVTVNYARFKPAVAPLK